MNPDDWKFFPVSYYNPNAEMTMGLLRARCLRYQENLDRIKTADQTLLNVMKFIAAAHCHQCDKQRYAKTAIEDYKRNRDRDD